MNKKDVDIFINQKVYPEAEAIFGLSLSSIEDIKDICKVVVDTNALVVPYSTGKDSLKALGEVFGELKKQGRLIVPGQVAREFANIRPDKLKGFQQLTTKESKAQSMLVGDYPLLENIKEYQDAIALEKELNQKIKEYRQKINELIRKVKSWTWNDPVSLLYQGIFTPDTILDLKFDEDKVKDMLKYRYNHQVPPGYSDGGKPDDGIGDLLIWLTILDIGKAENDVIFISGDEKKDWFHRSEKTALFPRFELVNEFKAASKGKSFHILKLSEFSKLFGVENKVVEEIAKEEKHSEATLASFNEFRIQAQRAVIKWMQRFHNYTIEINPVGFPDYIFEAADYKKCGLQIIPLVNSSENVFDEKQFYLSQASSSFRNKTFNINRLYVFFIARNEYKGFGALQANVEDFIGHLHSIYNIDIEYFVGYLDTDGSFEYNYQGITKSY